MPRSPERLEERLALSAYLPAGTAAPSGCTCPSCSGYTFAGQTTTDNAYQTPGYKWAQSSPGAPVTITYSYSNLLDGGLGGGLSAGTIKAAVQEALSRWAAVAPLTFVEVPDSGPAPSGQNYTAAGNPMMRFGHIAIDGAYNVLAYGYYPGSSGLAGDIQFDRAENWKVNPSGGIDLLEVATHEIGHALGLGHEPMPSSGGQQAIMNPYYAGRYGGLGTSYLFADDINGIRALYGAGSGLVQPLGTAASSQELPAGKEDDYIARLYQTSLGRSASRMEINSWLPTYSSQGVAGLIAGIERSAEARTRLVKSYYQEFLGRQAQGGEEQGWVQNLLNGASRESVIAGILGSAEFYARAQTLGTGSTTDERYVSALYQLLLNRGVDGGGLNYWKGVIQTQGRAAVVQGLLSSLEYRSLEVQEFYTGLLQRSGSAQDVTGWAASGADLQVIRESFLRSAEFISKL